MITTNRNKVYIAETTTIIPRRYSPEELANVFYPSHIEDQKTLRIARRLSKQMGVENRYSVLDVSQYPQKKLLKDEYSAKNWGSEVIDKLTRLVDPDDIGYFSTSYNVSSHQEILPSLSSQIASANNLKLVSYPQETPFYGCASGILALESGIEFCRHHNKAAILYIYDQCSWISNPIYDSSHQNFAASLRTTLLFNDGAVGILLIPDTLLHKYSYKKLIELIDVDFGFYPGNAICMEDKEFLVGDNIKDVMPHLTSQKSITPLLKRNNLNPNLIKEWSIHQGGLPVLEKFKDSSILGLTDEQLLRSKEMFVRYGNMSSTSCFFVLDSFLNEPYQERNSYGIVAAFGAGYYYGTALYKWM
jgi:predicted naringenin-chalcone synthase